MCVSERTEMASRWQCREKETDDVSMPWMPGNCYWRDIGASLRLFVIRLSLSPFYISVPFPSTKLAPKPRMGALPMHRCASVDWTFRCSLECPPITIVRSAFISMNTMLCPDVHWLVSIVLHQSFFSSFFPPFRVVVVMVDFFFSVRSMMTMGYERFFHSEKRSERLARKDRSF